MKYFLIHGYGKSLDIREKQIPDNLGFYIFDDEIKNKQAYVFDWAIREERSFFSKINLFSQLSLYYQEKSRVEDIVWQKELSNKINENNPEFIICHSLGCQLLLNTISRYGLPKSVKEIIFILADIAQKNNLDIITSRNIKLTNIYCFWDNALLSSMIINRYLPIGLLGVKNMNKVNLFWKLRYGINLHQDIWRDKNFKLKITEIIPNS